MKVDSNGVIYRCQKSTGEYFKPPQFYIGRNKNYAAISVCFDGKQYYLYTHRFVATVYIPNPQNKPEVNHIDGNPRNNSISNLEWSTRQENTIHAYKIGLFPRIRKKSKPCLRCGKLTIRENQYCCKCDDALQRKNRRVIKVQEYFQNIKREQLTTREQIIFDDKALDKTNADIARRLGITRERVRQIINVLGENLKQ